MEQKTQDDLLKQLKQKYNIKDDGSDEFGAIAEVSHLYVRGFLPKEDVSPGVFEAELDDHREKTRKILREG